MPILGTKKFWKPASGASSTQKENQILKNSGYLNLQIRSVNYMSKGNFWQNTFGGSDRIALATNLKYQTGVETIEATAVQDIREVKVNRNYNLGLNRNIAVKIPLNADAISLDVKMTAVKNDLLEAKFDMLNKTEYQSALELAPTVIGQVITVTSLVKKLFSDSNPDTQMEASYAGIISAQSENNPVENGKLTKGLLILISTNDGNTFSDVDEADFEMRGDALYYKNEEVENTYVVFNISFDLLKGDDEKSNWFKKYSDSLNNLDKIISALDTEEIQKIHDDSINMWIEGNALIDADPTYIYKEKLKIKSLALKTIRKKYSEFNIEDSAENLNKSADILSGLTGTTSFNIIKDALPSMGSFIEKRIDIKSNESLNSLKLDVFNNNNELLESLDFDSEAYLKDLEINEIPFHLGKK
jgi:exonuclease VII small subunit